MKFVMATHNTKKLKELARILAPLGMNVVSEGDLPFDFPDVEETGATFAENALLKARSACTISGLPAVADDSGLCVDALDGAPGVYSARYGGEHGKDAVNNQLLLRNLEGVPKEKRTAHFVSCVACVFPDGRSFTVEGRCDGIIGDAPKGENGFGYDPLFLVGEKSFAQLSAEEKDAISHRGRALRAFVTRLQEEIKHVDQ